MLGREARGGDGEGKGREGGGVCVYIVRRRGGRRYVCTSSGIGTLSRV